MPCSIAFNSVLSVSVAYVVGDPRGNHTFTSVGIGSQLRLQCNPALGTCSTFFALSILVFDLVKYLNLFSSRHDLLGTLGSGG